MWEWVQRVLHAFMNVSIHDSMPSQGRLIWAETLHHITIFFLIIAPSLKEAPPPEKSLIKI